MPSLRRAIGALALLLLSACATGIPTAPVDANAAAARPPEDVPVVTLVAAAAAASAPATSAPAASAALAKAAPELVAAGDSAAAVQVTPANLPVDPLRPEVPVNLDDRAARTDLWRRVREGFVIADLDDDYVRRRERYYAGKPDYVQRMAERGGRYLFHIVEEVQKRNLPTELALLPFIESAFNPEALSRARASGMWQFMPATGRHFELKQNVFRDDRRDVLASTRAALDYLTKLHAMFGDWHLALAAYNWGEGSVQRAIKRNQKAGKPTNYANLKMPAETRDYVPKLQAMKNIVANPAAFSLRLPELQNHPYFLSVAISRDIDVATAVRLSGLPVEEFNALNPQLNKPVILAAGTPQLLLPYDNANAFAKGIDTHRGPLASWTAWVAPRTMKSADAAQQVGMSDADLRSVNNIPPQMLIKAGSTLLVPRHAQRQADVSEKVANDATMSLTYDGPAVRRMVFRTGKKGDSVAAVAKRYRVSADQVAQWNHVGATAQFAPGSSVVVFVAARSSKAAPARASAGKASTKRPAAASTKRGAAPIKPIAVKKKAPVRR